MRFSYLKDRIVVYSKKLQFSKLMRFKKHNGRELNGETWDQIPLELFDTAAYEGNNVTQAGYQPALGDKPPTIQQDALFLEAIVGDSLSDR